MQERKRALKFRYIE